MDVCRVLVLFYFSYFSLTSGVTNALTADVVFDVLSRRFDNIIHEIKTVKSDVAEIRHGINKLEKRIENVEHSASDIKTLDDNSVAGISHFGMPDRLKRQSKVLHKMLATEKVILREAVDQLQNTFSDFQSEIRSQMSSMNMYVGESVENLNRTVTNHMSDVNMDVSALKLDLQNKMDVSENKLDEIDKEVNEVKAEVKLDVTNAKAEVTSRLGSEIANVKTNLRSIEKQQEKRTVDIDVQISDLQRRIAKEESTSSQLSRRISTEEVRKVAFSAHLTTKRSYYGKSQIIVFNRIIYSHGGGYDSSTGIFTAPKSGTYIFTYNVQSVSTGLAHVVLKVRGTIKTRAIAEKGGDITGGNVGIDYLSKGDKAWIETASLESRYYIWPYRTTFNGILID